MPRLVVNGDAHAASPSPQGADQSNDPFCLHRALVPPSRPLDGQQRDFARARTDLVSHNDGKTLDYNTATLDQRGAHHDAPTLHSDAAASDAYPTVPRSGVDAAALGVAAGRPANASPSHIPGSVGRRTHADLTAHDDGSLVNMTRALSDARARGRCNVEAYQLRTHGGGSSLQVDAVPLNEHAASVALRCTPAKKSLPWDDRQPFNFDYSASLAALGNPQQQQSPVRLPHQQSPVRDPRRRVTDVTISDDDTRSPHLNAPHLGSPHAIGSPHTNLGRGLGGLGSLAGQQPPAQANMDRSWRRPFVSASGVTGHVGGDSSPLRWE